VDDERLKNPPGPARRDSFDELLECIRGPSTRAQDLVRGPMVQMGQVTSDADPEDVESDAIVEASELTAAGETSAGYRLVVSMLLDSSARRRITRCCLFATQEE